MLRSMGSQRVRHDWGTEQQQYCTTRLLSYSFKSGDPEKSLSKSETDKGEAPEGGPGREALSRKKMK